MSRIWKPERVTKIDETLKVEWYAEETIVAYVLSEMLPEVLQSWSNTVLDVLRNWPYDEPYLALYDLSRSGVVISYLGLMQRRMFSLGITEAGEERALASIVRRGNLNSRVALYVSMRHSGRVGRLFATIDAQRTRRDRMVQYDIFYERQVALNWLNAVQTRGL